MPHARISKIKLTIPGELTHLPSVREFIEYAVTPAHFPTNELQRVVTAAFEAVVNAATHGSPLGAGNSVGIIVSVYEDRVVVEVTDQGPGFPADSLRDMPDATSARGRGIALMRSLVDDVRLTNDNGGRVVLTKLRG